MKAAALAFCAWIALSGGVQARGGERIEALPSPVWPATAPLDSLLRSRQSVRTFAPDTLSAAMAARLLWAAGGITREDRLAHRTAPSAGALFPLEVHWVTARGMARYDPRAHTLIWRSREDRRQALAAAALGQPWVATAPATLVIASVPQRTQVKYGERGDRYVLIEAGCASQNVLLAAVALGLGAVPVGAFDDDAVARLLQLPDGERPLLLIPVGRPAASPRP